MKLPVKYDDLKPHQKKKVREEYRKLQNDKCLYCNSPLSGECNKDLFDVDIDLSLFPPGMLKYPIHLHHDHKTGLTKGVVHARCNCILWQYHNE